MRAMAYSRTSQRREKRDLREQMRTLGLDYPVIAAEFARRYTLRPRAAWREAYGWSLQDTADRINASRGDTGLDPGGLASVTSPHLSEYETWPGHGDKPAGRRPSPYLLAVLACVYNCAVTDLIDLADRQHLPPADLLILDKYTQTSAPPPHPDHMRTESPATGPPPEGGLPAFLPDSGPTASDLTLWAAGVPGLDSLGSREQRLEEHDPVRRRTFVGLTGASLLRAVFSEPTPDGAHEAEALAAALTGSAADLALQASGWLPDMAGTDSRGRRGAAVVPGMPLLRADQAASGAALSGRST